MIIVSILSFIVITLFSIVQLGAPNKLVDFDSYYHIKMAQIMRSSQDLTPNFVWLPQTVLSEQNFFDLHWLFHVLLIPFAQGNLILGGKIAAVVFASLALLSAGFLIRSQKVPFWPLWTILIFGSSAGLVYRMSMLREPSLSLAWILVSISLILKQRYKWLILTSLTYVWLYSGYPILIVIAGIYVAAFKIAKHRWQLKVPIYITVGILLGLVVNPYFPKDLTFLFYNLSDKFLHQNIPIGIAEWEPYPPVLILRHGGLGFLLTFAGIAAVFKSRRFTVENIFLLGMCALTGVMFLRYQRFVEYFPVFATIFCAVATAPFVANIRNRRYFTISAATITIFLCIYTVAEVKTLTSFFPPANRVENAALFLKSHTPKGSLVFHDYADFGPLFFENTHNTYTIGLDLSFLYRTSPEKLAIWLLLKQGEVENVAQTINRHFGANYIVWDLQNKPFLTKAFADPRLKEVFRDENMVIFHLDLF